MNIEKYQNFRVHKSCEISEPCRLFCQRASVIRVELSYEKGRMGETGLKHQLQESKCRHPGNLAYIADANKFLASK